MTGTSTFVWHDEKPRYDEVAWVPESVTADEAGKLALSKLQEDQRATRVQVAFSELAFVEIIRYAA